MANPYFYECKVYTNPTQEYIIRLMDFKVRDEPAELKIKVLPYELEVHLLIEKASPVFDVEWRLFILDEKRNIRIRSPIVKFNSKTKYSFNWISFFHYHVGLDNRVHLGVDVRTTVIEPIVKEFKEYKDDPSDGIVIRVSGPYKWLQIPPEIVDNLPDKLKALLMKRPNVCLYYEDDVKDYTKLHIDPREWYNESYNYDQLTRLGVLFLKWTTGKEESLSDTLFTCRNFLNMVKNVGKIDIPNTNISGCHEIIFKRPNNSSWIDVIKKCGKVYDDESLWELGLFVTICNNIAHLGCFVSYQQNSLIKCDITLELRGCISRKDEDGKAVSISQSKLTFHLTPTNFNGQYILSCPVLTTMAKLEKIGMEDEGATVVLKVKKRRKQDRIKGSRVITFPGITNYTIHMGDDKILINRGLLKHFSERFFRLGGAQEDFDEENLIMEENDNAEMIDLLRIVYGNVIPVSYPSLGKMLVLTHKYKFFSLLRYLDLSLVFLAREKRLPQVWADNTPTILYKLPIYVLDEYFEEEFHHQYQSIVPMDDEHHKWLIEHNILKSNFLTDDTDPETVKHRIELSKRPRLE